MSTSSTTSNNKDISSPNKYHVIDRILGTSKNKYFIDLNNYTITGSTNKGYLGSINFVTEKSTSKRYITKKSYQASNNDHFFLILREMAHLINIQHPTINSIEGYCFEEDIPHHLLLKQNKYITILSEYEPNGTLADLLRKEIESNCPSDYNNTKRQTILIGVARSLKYLHKNKIIHGDLKAENVLIDKDYEPRVTDFGISKIFNPYNLPSKNDAANNTTLTYLAPEIIKGGCYSQKSDVYAFGILMYEVLSGKRAYNELFESENFNRLNFERKILKENLRPSIDFPIKKGLKQMIESCLSKSPKKRPTIDEIYNKLSIQEKGEIFDLEYDPVIEDEDGIFPFNNYCLDDVNDEELNEYIEIINSDSAFSKEMLNFHKTLEEFKKEVHNLMSCDFILLDCRFSHLIDELELLKALNESPAGIQLYKIRKNVENNILTKIEIPEGLTSLPRDLFNKYKSLEEVKIPSSVTFIGHSCFSGCESLKSVVIPSSVKEMKHSVFFECASLETIDLSSTQIEEIEFSTFENCTSLKKIELPQTLTEIGSYVFKNCKMLENLTIPPSVNSINTASFHLCSSLKSIEIPSSMNCLSCHLFGDCTSLVNVTIPSSIVEIRSKCFENCSSLKCVEFPSVTQISENVFNGCTSLEKIVINSSLNIDSIGIGPNVEVERIDL